MEYFMSGREIHQNYSLEYEKIELIFIEEN